MKTKTSKKITLEDLAGMVNNGFKEADKKQEELKKSIDNRFVEVHDHLDGLENRMTNIEKLLLKNDDEHKMFRTKISILEKSRH
ncbi:MAG: hypothetical protein WC827_02495 [Candidatus Paceibacterota bacterium]|jgi:hypothetical protein